VSPSPSSVDTRVVSRCTFASTKRCSETFEHDDPVGVTVGVRRVRAD
jgi:hypothetical protein